MISIKVDVKGEVLLVWYQKQFDITENLFSSMSKRRPVFEYVLSSRYTSPMWSIKVLTSFYEETFLTMQNISNKELIFAPNKILHFLTSFKAG